MSLLVTVLLLIVRVRDNLYKMYIVKYISDVLEILHP